MCEVSDDPVGVELAGVAKNAAAVAVGATQAQGLNAAGMAAADIFLEVLALAASSGGKARTFVGRGRHGRPGRHRARARRSRNRSAGELLAEGVPAAEIPERVGQAVEALETVPLLAHAIERAGVEAPVTVGARAPDRGHAAAWTTGSRSCAPSSRRRRASAGRAPGGRACAPGSRRRFGGR